MRWITTWRYDVSGSEMMRVAKHALISKLAKYEDFSGGPGFRDLLLAFSVHYFGGFLAWVMLRFERRSAWVVAFLQKHSGRG